MKKIIIILSYLFFAVVFIQAETQTESADITPAKDNAAAAAPKKIKILLKDGSAKIGTLAGESDIEIFIKEGEVIAIKKTDIASIFDVDTGNEINIDTGKEITPGSNSDSTDAIMHKKWYYGGPARMMALGDIENVLPDSTNVIDLYSQGFTSGMLYRERANIISLCPQGYGFSEVGSNNYTIDFDSPSSYTDLRLTNDSDNFLLFWISPADVMEVCPTYDNYSYPLALASQSWFYTTAVKFSYTHSFNNAISAGIMLKPSALDVDEEKIFANNFEYMIDISDRLSDELIMALSAGKQMPEVLMQNALEITNFNIYPDWTLNPGEGYSGSETGYINSKFYTNWVNVDMGAQYLKKGVFKAVFSGGVILGYNYDMKTGTNTTGEIQQYHDNGIGYNAAFKCRAYINDSLIAGFSA